MRQTILSLVILSFMLGFITPACGFMWGGKYSVIEICTDQGIEQRVVRNKDNPNKPNHSKAENTCDFCFQNANLSAYLISTHTDILSIYNMRVTTLFNHQNIVALTINKTHLARGPPALS